VLLPTGLLAMPAGCTTGDLVVYAFDNSNTLLATLYHPALAVTQDESVDLGADSFTAAQSAAFTYSNAPGTTVTAQLARIGRAGVLATVEQTSDVGNGGATFTLAEPVIANTTAVVDTRFVTPNNTHDVWDWGGNGGDYTLDLSGQALVDITDAPAFDAAAGRLTWTPGTTGVAPDFVSANLVTAGDPSVSSWSIVAPYAGGSLQLPQIPGYVLAATDTVQVQALQTAKVPGGYDAVRAYALAPPAAFFLIADGATGRALLDAYALPQVPPSISHAKRALRKRSR
jgi:hypothetical protein